MARWPVVPLLLASAFAPVEPAVAQMESYTETVSGTLVSFEMVPVSGGVVSLSTDAGADSILVSPFWIGRTEVTWDLYDVFAFRLDVPREERRFDATARPSRPYGAPDWGFGHQGYPAISIAREAAQAFCVWLSEKTGHKYRLPTESEWLLVANSAFDGADTLPPDILDRIVWHRNNSGGTTHAVGSREPDGIGLYDLLGNAAEWVIPEDSARITMGGSYRDSIKSTGHRSRQVSAWNERDPQIPKSRWWLSDGPFVGFRIVREP